jgi:hypothetical protein
VIDFSGTMTEVAQGLLVKPLIENWLDQATTVRFPGVPARDLGVRAPDGYFHPSTHPAWSERQLYEYLAHPDRLIGEQMGVESKKSVTWGTAAHTFNQWILRQIGVLPPELQRCQVCPPEKKCKEPGFHDPKTGSRTHADGVLALPGRYGLDIFEYKSAGSNTYQAYKRLKAIEDLDVEALRKTYPYYYDQAIEVQRISGLSRTVLVMEVWGFPWTMREFHIEWDPEQAERVEQKYLRVREAFRTGNPPQCLCRDTERAGCVARRACS